MAQRLNLSGVIFHWLNTISGVFWGTPRRAVLAVIYGRLG